MLLELETDPALLLDAELEEQLAWAPPELEDEPESVPLFPTTTARLEVWGPILAALAVPDLPVLVEALELVEQLPELPPTDDCPLKLCVLVELLQLYPIVLFGVFVIRIVAAKKTAPIQISLLFIIFILPRTINVISYGILVQADCLRGLSKGTSLVR